MGSDWAGDWVDEVGQSPLPLAKYEVLRSGDFDHVRDQVGSLFGQHNSRPIQVPPGFLARVHAAALEHVSLVYLDYGASVYNHFPDYGTFYAVLLPNGNDVLRQNNQEVRSAPAIGSPTIPIEGGFDLGCQVLLVKVDRAALEGHLERLLARPIDKPIIFDLAMDTSEPHTRSLLNAVHFVQHDFDTGGAIASHPLAAAQAESLIMTSLLLGQPNNYSEVLQTAQRPALPRSIKRAVEIIRMHPEQPLTLDQLATACAVSVRSLQEGFRRYLGTTPMAYLREVRLDRVHAELAISGPADGKSVTDIALRWGFSHLGRFSTAYRRKFGVKPSETLRT